jgi:hypothetical protein
MFTLTFQFCETVSALAPIHNHTKKAHMTRTRFARTCQLTSVALLLVVPPSLLPMTASPYMGRKIDNYLNQNIPYLVWSTNSQIHVTGDVMQDPYDDIPDSPCFCENIASGSFGIEVAWYDQLTTEQQAQVNANNAFETVFGYVTGFATGYAFGGPAASLARSAVGALGAGAAGQWLSGAFGAGLTGVAGETVGSW